MNRYRAYTLGLGLSLVLTMAAYLLVDRHVHSHHLIYSDSWLIAVIIALALGQFIAQMIFFMHLGAEPKPKWNVAVFGFMATVVLILVIGSLWIMNSLNYHVDSPTMTDKSIIKDEGFRHYH